jgi:hypothetical protein
MTTKIELNFALEKTTPGALQYKEVVGGRKIESMYEGTVGSLYLRKDKLINQGVKDGDWPREIKVTLEL